MSREGKLTPKSAAETAEAANSPDGLENLFEGLGEVAEIKQNIEEAPKLLKKAREQGKKSLADRLQSEIEDFEEILKHNENIQEDLQNRLENAVGPSETLKAYADHAGSQLISEGVQSEVEKVYDKLTTTMEEIKQETN